MADKMVRMTSDVWKRAKVAAAEADVPLRTFIDKAVVAAIAKHNARKQDEVRVEPVEFVGRS